MIKSVIFDLGGVYYTDGTRIAAQRISKKHNLDFDFVFKIFWSGSELGSQYRRGEISCEGFWNKAESVLGIKANHRDLNRLWLESYQPIKGTIEIIQRLKNKGIRLYFLSDSVPERVEHLREKFNFLKDFTDGVFSFKAHMTKRDGIGIFKMALEKTGEKPENVVYIDDKGEFVETAKKLGINGICFKSPEQLREELKNLGL